MADKGKKASKDKTPKRRNKTIGVGDALGGIIDPALKKRGFASRDLIAHWDAMVPEPYDKCTQPDRLHWPRGPEAANGAILYLRCQPAHALAVAHEAPRLAGAINRYFGYVLVGSVKLSAEPMEVRKPQPDEAFARPTPEVEAEIEAAVSAVGDDGLRDALRTLGEGVRAPKRR